jgi:hypothetical protein
MEAFLGSVKTLWIGLAEGSVIPGEENRRAFHRSTSYIELNQPQAQAYCESKCIPA